MSVAAGARSIIFEVEIPEQAQTEPERALAERRICFYQRQGAYLLEGISYFQVIGPHQNPIPMHLMVHGVEPLSPGDAFSIAKQVFGDLVTQTGALELR
jgi:hypothetical protein